MRRWRRRARRAHRLYQPVITFFVATTCLIGASGHRCMKVLEVYFISFFPHNDARCLPVVSLLHNVTALTTK